MNEWILTGSIIISCSEQTNKQNKDYLRSVANISSVGPKLGFDPKTQSRSSWIWDFKATWEQGNKSCPSLVTMPGSRQKQMQILSRRKHSQFLPAHYSYYRINQIWAHNSKSIDIQGTKSPWKRVTKTINNIFRLLKSSKSASIKRKLLNSYVGNIYQNKNGITKTVINKKL